MEFTLEKELSSQNPTNWTQISELESMNMTPSPIRERRETLLKVINTAAGLKDYLKFVKY